MSMPNIPDICPKIELEMDDIVKLIMSSIALEEISLSHLLNAESEKIQYVVSEKNKCHSLDDLIDLNKSVEKIVVEVSKIEGVLLEKMITTKEFQKKYCKDEYKCNWCKNRQECNKNDDERIEYSKGGE